MLLIRPISERQIEYYFRDPADFGVYGGAGSKAFGLSGLRVTEETLGDLARGLDPRDGQSLARGHRVQNVAFDCVMSAPKSVSLLFALSGQRTSGEVVMAHRAAEAVALDYFERVASWFRTRSGGPRTLERTDGLLWASFLHRTSRAGDPHLHSHVLIVSLVSSAGQHWFPLNPGPLFAERSVAAGLYENELRYELVRRLGRTFRARSGPASDVVGFSDRVIDAFSLRRLAILEDPRAAKPPKVVDPPQAVLTSRWREQAASLGVIDRDRPLVAGVLSDQRAVSEAVEDALKRFDRPFRRGELLRGVSRSGRLAAPSSQIEQTVDRLLAERTEQLPPGRLAAFENRAQRNRWDRRVEWRYVTHEVAAALEKESSIRASAAFLGADGYGTFQQAFERAPVVAASSTSDAMTTYTALRSLAETMRRSGKTLRAVTSAVRSLADFEALTGLPGEVLDARSPTIRDDVVVLMDPVQLSAARRVAIIEGQIERGGRVVVLDAWRLDESTVSAPPTQGFDAGPKRVEGEWLQVAETKIGLFDTLPGAIAALEARVRELGPHARGVVPRRISPWVDVANVPASEVRSAAQSGLGPFVVLGGRRSLVRPPTGSRFEHVVVEPLGLRPNEREAAARALITTRGIPGHARYSSETWRAAGWMALANDRSTTRARKDFDREPVDAIRLAID